MSPLGAGRVTLDHVQRPEPSDERQGCATGPEAQPSAPSRPGSERGQLVAPGLSLAGGRGCIEGCPRCAADRGRPWWAGTPTASHGGGDRRRPHHSRRHVEIGGARSARAAAALLCWQDDKTGSAACCTTLLRRCRRPTVMTCKDSLTLTVGRGVAPHPHPHPHTRHHHHQPHASRLTHHAASLTAHCHPHPHHHPHPRRRWSLGAPMTTTSAASHRTVTRSSAAQCRNL